MTGANTGQDEMKQASIKKNFLMNALLALSNALFPLITYMHVSRALLTVGMGKFSFATSLIAWFSMFAQLGIPEYGVRACAKVRDNREELTRTAHELLLINLMTNAAVYLVFFLSLAVVPRLQGEKTLYILMSTTILLTSLGMEWLYKGLEQYTYITVRSIVCKVIALALVFLLVREEKDYIIYGVLSIFAASASNVLNLAFAHRHIGFRPVGKYNLARHMRPVLVFFAMACATTIYTNLDILMLGFLRSEADVGIYNASVRVKSLLVSVITSLGTVLLPRASYYVHHGRMEDFRDVSRKALRFVFLAAAPCMTFFFLFAEPAIRVLSGAEFLPAARPMRLLMPTLLLIGVTNILGFEIMVPTDREKLVLYSVVAGALVDLILNAALIPAYSAAGAAFSTLIAEAAVLLIQLWFLRKETPGIFAGIPYTKILAALLPAVLLSFWTVRLGLHDFLTLAIAAALFFGGYGAALLIAHEPMAVEAVGFLQKALRKRLKK